jgi:hypothetical protein
MEKFSNITNQKVNQVPQLIEDKDKIKLQALKAGITKLMDNFLTIRSYGGAKTEHLMSSVKISGKELFIEALIDFMNDKSVNDQIETLESIKMQTRDWQSIDNKINELNFKINEELEFNKNSKQISKIKTLIETYGDDERFETILENLVNKTKTSEEAESLSFVANKMIKNFKYLEYSKNQLKLISEKYYQKSKELNFRENGTSRG